MQQSKKTRVILCRQCCTEHSKWLSEAESIPEMSSMFRMMCLTFFGGGFLIAFGVGRHLMAFLLLFIKTLAHLLCQCIPRLLERTVCMNGYLLFPSEFVDHEVFSLRSTPLYQNNNNNRHFNAFVLLIDVIWPLARIQ